MKYKQKYNELKKKQVGGYITIKSPIKSNKSAAETFNSSTEKLETTIDLTPHINKTFISSPIITPNVIPNLVPEVITPVSIPYDPYYTRPSLFYPYDNYDIVPRRRYEDRYNLYDDDDEDDELDEILNKPFKYNKDSETTLNFDDSTDISFLNTSEKPKKKKQVKKKKTKKKASKKKKK